MHHVLAGTLFSCCCVACVSRDLRFWVIFFSLQPLNWWYSSFHVHISSKRHSIYRDGSKLEYSRQCVTNSTSLLQTNMLYLRWRPEKKLQWRQSIYYWRWIWIFKSNFFQLPTSFIFKSLTLTAHAAAAF